jgi:hypothetical protein
MLTALLVGVAGDRNIGTNGTGMGCPQVAAILRFDADNGLYVKPRNAVQ